jgi:hypothetical protein
LNPPLQLASLLAVKWNLACFVAACLVSACSVTGNLFPVQGPLTKAQPLPVIPIKIDGVTGNSGPASLTLPDGEKCVGRWSVVAPRMVGSMGHSGSGTISSGLDTAFVQVHGRSFVNVGAPGVNQGQAMLIGASGTVIEAAFLVGSGTASGYGVAKDNRGNVFKVLF